MTLHNASGVVCAVSGVVTTTPVAQTDTWCAAIGGWRRGGRHRRGRTGCRVAVGAGTFRVRVVVVVWNRRGFSVDLHVLPERAGVCIALVTAFHLTVVGLVAGVYVGMLLAVRTIGKATITALEFAFERFLAWNR